ncbi:Transcription initiation factor TFIID subunit 12 [Sporothrix eucalyptigena]
MNQGSPQPTSTGAPGTPGTPGAAGVPMQQQASQQGQPGQPGQQQPVMYRPEQMRNIKELTAQERQKYESGLRVLWQTVADKPEGSQEREIARRKILEFTPVLARKIRERRLAAINRQNVLKQQQQQQQQQEGSGQPMQIDGQPTAQQLQQAQAAAQAQAQAAALAAQGQNPAQMQAAQAAQANAMAQAQLRANAAAAAGAGAKPGVAGSPPAGPQQQAQPGAAGPQQQPRPQQPPKFSDTVLQNLNLLSYLPPPALADKPAEVVTKWQEDVRKKLGMSLSQIEMARANIAKLDASYKMRSNNNQLTPDDMKAYKDRREMLQKVLDDSARFVAVYRKQQDQTKVYMQQKLMQQQAAGGAAAGGQQPAQRPPQQAGATAQQPTPQQPTQNQQQKNVKTEPTNMQNSQANINGAIEAAKKESIAAGARQGAGNNMAINNNANNAGNAAAAPTKPTPGIVQQTPIPPPVIPAAAMQGAPKQPPKPPVQTPVHPPPTPINTAIAAANKSGGPATAGTPTPVSAAAAAAAAAGRVPPPAQMATPVNAAPRALSHQKALEEANKQRAASISNGAVSTPPSGHVAANGAAPTSGAVTPGGSNNANANAAAQNQQMHQAQHQAMQQNQMAMNQQQQQQQQSAAATAAASSGANGAAGQNGVTSATQEAARMNAKMTEPRQMSKQLSEKASQMPQPVSLGGGIVPGRPTLSGGGGVVGGVLGQAAIAKVPAIQIDGEGERVLNKKRLDELVRQVCGGTAEGHEGNLLQPEVEESVLNLADSFVDSVLHSACRNAKERGSKVLEIRDLQLVLERTYNIRIPGYSSDELRTVRKVQPSMAWITKMSVIQAAKVTSATKNDL